jgi:hypothetical protein
MEIHKGTVTPVKFYLPTPDSTVSSASYSFKGSTSAPLNVTSDTQAATANLPYFNEEGICVVTWNFSVPGSGTFTDTQTISVVTPILAPHEIKEIHPNVTPVESLRVEKAVRHIINAHCGQDFGKYVGPHRVYGDGSTVLSLPARLIELEDINGITEHYSTIGADGWVLYTTPWGVPPVKADAWGLHQHVGGVIHNPNHIKLGQWQDKRGYDVNGTWGWYHVPEQVKEAAKLLINDYACGEQSYRDRYLTSMTAADWRIQFHSGAFRETGNVRADQLLNDFVLKRGWAVI